MNYLILFIVSFAFVFKLTGQTTNYQLLWEVTAPKGKKSYLFGSMHSNDSRVFHFPDSLYVAFVKSEMVVIETDITPLFDQFDVRLERFSMEIARGNQPIQNARSATQTVYGSEDGRPQFLDAYLQQTAYIAAKPVVSLEKLSEQLAASESINAMTVKRGLGLRFSQEAFMNNYLSGDLVGLNQMLKSQLETIPGAYERLITQRNVGMVKGLDTLMRKRTVFCAVGSGHFYGPEGIIQLLRNKGFRLRPMMAGYAETPIKEKELMLSWNSILMRKEKFGFEMEWNGRPLITDSVNQFRCIYQDMGQGNTFQLNVYTRDMSNEDCLNEFVDLPRQRPTRDTLIDGTIIAQGMFRNTIHGLQWKRVVITSDFTYILTCYGGNKFMHSNRPIQFFERLKLIKP